MIELPPLAHSSLSRAAAQDLAVSIPWVDLGNSIVGVVTLLLGLIAIYWTRRHFRIAKTLDYIRAFNSPEMVPVRARVIQWTDAHANNEAELIEAFEKDPDLQANVWAFVNLLTEYAIAYESNIVDRRIANALWYPLLPTQWEVVQPWALWRRSLGYEVGVYLERVSNTVANANSKSEASRKASKPI